MLRERYGRKAARVAYAWARDLERQGYEKPARHWRTVSDALSGGGAYRNDQDKGTA